MSKIDVKAIAAMAIRLQKEHGANVKDSSFSFGKSYQEFRKNCKWSDPITHPLPKQMKY